MPPAIDVSDDFTQRSVAELSGFAEQPAKTRTAAIISDNLRIISSMSEPHWILLGDVSSLILHNVELKKGRLFETSCDTRANQTA